MNHKLLWQSKMKNGFLIISVLFSATFFVLVSTSSNPLYAGQLGYSNISAPMVKNIIDHNQGVLINVLSELEYEIQHITGSINIPLTKLATTDLLPADKSVTLILYCMGER